MIQRLQSVFLLIMAVCMLIMLFVPIWITGNPTTGELVILDAFQLRFEDQSGLMPEVLAVKSTIYISILAILAAGISLFSIFQYKNRLTQMKLGALNSLILAGVVGSAYFALTKGKAMIDVATFENFKLGFILPVIALLFNSLANRFIRRDEKLVSDSNRMR